MGNHFNKKQCCCSYFHIINSWFQQVHYWKIWSYQTFAWPSRRGTYICHEDAASAIYNLCLVHDNKERTVREGAVKVILNKIMNHILVDELLAILALLSCHPDAVEEMGNRNAVPFLMRNIRESTSERCKENCVAILYTICYSRRTKLKEIKEEEKANGTLSMLAQCGTSRAKRKANSILERLNRSQSLTHTA